MKFFPISSIHNYLFLLLSLYTAAVNAQLGPVSGNNTPSQLTITATGRSQINWTVIENAANGGQVVISSPNGVFLTPGGSVLATVTKPLKTTRNVLNGSVTTFSFSEALTIPQSILRLAQKKGFSRFVYTRQFTDFPDNTAKTAVVSFSISGGGAAGGLRIRRVEMEFDDGRITAVLAPDNRIKAHTVISYSGTGLLEYTWEVASPPSTQGQPVFVPITSRRQYLLAGDKVVLLSPNLPSGMIGNYRVRLRIDKPKPDFQLPELRFAVNRSGQSRIKNRIVPLQVIRPAPDALLINDTLFAWRPITAASVYQLELYTRPVRDSDLPGASRQTPITGVLVPAEKTQLTVGSLSRAHLLVGNHYYWRVIALSEKGQVIARSDFRRINF